MQAPLIKATVTPWHAKSHALSAGRKAKSAVIYPEAASFVVEAPVSVLLEDEDGHEMSLHLSIDDADTLLRILTEGVARARRRLAFSGGSAATPVARPRGDREGPPLLPSRG
jgi:hypothetical protein